MNLRMSNICCHAEMTMFNGLLNDGFRDTSDCEVGLSDDRLQWPSRSQPTGKCHEVAGILVSALGL